MNASQFRKELFYSVGLRHHDGKEDQCVGPVPLPRKKRWCRRKIGVGTEELTSSIFEKVRFVEGVRDSEREREREKGFEK